MGNEFLQVVGNALEFENKRYKQQMEYVSPNFGTIDSHIEAEELNEDRYEEGMETNSNDSDLDYLESDCDMEDDDNQVFKVNIDLRIEQDMGGQLNKLGSAIIRVEQRMTIQNMRTQYLCIVLMNLMMMRMPLEGESFQS